MKARDIFLGYLSRTPPAPLFTYLHYPITYSKMSVPLNKLRVNGERLNSTLQSTCTSWGALSNSEGMCRLTCSQEDKDVRDWLVQECKALGCVVKVDTMGNIFAIRPGSC